MAGNFDLPSGWRWTTIGEVCDYVNRGRAPSYTDDSGVPVINQKCVRWSGVDWRHIKFTTPEAFARIDERQCLRDGDILWNSTGTGTSGRAAVYRAKADTPKVTVDTHITILRPRDILPRLLQLWISSHAVQGKMGTLQGGSTNQVELSRKAAMECPIPLPPEEYQPALLARIEELFGEIEAGEQELAAAKTDLGRYRRAVLKAAVTGELTRDWREQNPPNETGADLLARILKERRARWEDAARAKFAAKGQTPKNDAWKSRYPEPVIPNTNDLPELPEGWTWASLDQLIFDGPTNGYSPQNSVGAEGTWSLKLTATTSGRFRLDSSALKRLDETIPPDSKYWLEPGDLLIQRGNTIEYVGISAIFEGPQSTFVYPDLMMRVRLAERDLVHWVWRCINAPWTRAWVAARATGTAGTMPKINGEVVRAIPIPLPSAPEARCATELVKELETGSDELSGIVSSSEKESLRLRQSVLAAAFSGKFVTEAARATTKAKRRHVA